MIVYIMIVPQWSYGATFASGKHSCRLAQCIVLSQDWQALNIRIANFIPKHWTGAPWCNTVVHKTRQSFTWMVFLHRMTKYMESLNLQNDIMYFHIGVASRDWGTVVRVQLYRQFRRLVGMLVRMGRASGGIHKKKLFITGSTAGRPLYVSHRFPLLVPFSVAGWLSIRQGQA